MAKKLGTKEAPGMTEADLRALKAEDRDELATALQQVRDRCDRLLTFIEGAKAVR